MYKFIYLDKANKKVCQSYFHEYETCMEMEESYKKQYIGGHAIIIKMSVKEYAMHKVTEYTILKKAALKAEDWRMAEYYDTLIKDTLKEIITLA